MKTQEKEQILRTTDMLASGHLFFYEENLVTYDTVDGLNGQRLPHNASWQREIIADHFSSLMSAVQDAVITDLWHLKMEEPYISAIQRAISFKYKKSSIVTNANVLKNPMSVRWSL